MAKALKTKISIDQPESIPLDRLILHPDNVRSMVDKSSIASLAADIESRGLLQSLSVSPIDNENASYGVLAGGRRLRALQLLVKQKKLAKDALIPCIIRIGGTVEADSLAENVERQALHPLEQFRAFKSLADKGTGDETIAAIFRVTPAVVRQRLRLAKASPVLLKAYEEDEITLEQLMAFCLTEDHAKQDRAFKAIFGKGGTYYSDNPSQIRRMIAEEAISASDRRALFVGMEAYKAAGGAILRDLFSERSEGYLQDPVLLNQLVDAKLGEMARDVKEEGWAWVEVSVDIPWERQRDYVVIEPIAPARTDEEEEELEALEDELQPGEHDEDRAEEIENIKQRIAELEAKLPVYSDKQKASAGVFISLNYDGEVSIERGYAPREDKAPANGNDAHAGKPNGKANAEGDDGAKIPESLKTELTAYHTLGLRNAMAGNYTFAHLAVLHAMALRLFYRAYRSSSMTCLQIEAKDDLKTTFPTAGFRAADEIDARHKAFQAALPEDASELWEYLGSLTEQEAKVLFAHCAGLTVNAVHEKFTPPGKRDHAGQLAQALHLDMSDQGFVTTPENFFGRITKDAIKEAIGNEAYGKISTMKKKDMAKEAAKLAGDKWLPEPLRTSEYEVS